MNNQSFEKLFSEWGDYTSSNASDSFDLILLSQFND